MGDQNKRVFRAKTAGRELLIRSGVSPDGVGLAPVYPGGGIFNSGALSITDCSIVGNSASAETGFTGQGGGIYNLGHLSTSNLTLSNNYALDVGGGIDNEGTMSVSNSSLSGNSSGSDAGGVWNNSSSPSPPRPSAETPRSARAAGS